MRGLLRMSEIVVVMVQLLVLAGHVTIWGEFNVQTSTTCAT